MTHYTAASVGVSNTQLLCQEWLGHTSSSQWCLWSSTVPPHHQQQQRCQAFIFEVMASNSHQFGVQGSCTPKHTAFFHHSLSFPHSLVPQYPLPASCPSILYLHLVPVSSTCILSQYPLPASCPSILYLHLVPQYPLPAT